MLLASDVSFAVGGRKIVDCVNLALVPRRIVVLIGPNSAGKSVLLRMLSGELKPTSGKILLDARNIGTLRAEELGARRSVVPQSSLLTFAFTALEVALLGATVPGFGKESEATRQIALGTLESLGMAAARDQNYLHLSGGERQRLYRPRAVPTGSRSRRQAPDAVSSARRADLEPGPGSPVVAAGNHSRASSARLRRPGGAARLKPRLHARRPAAATVGRGASGRGTCRGSVGDDLLTAAYGCPVHVNRTPADGRPFVLPPASLSKTA